MKVDQYQNQKEIAAKFPIHAPWSLHIIRDSCTAFDSWFIHCTWFVIHACTAHDPWSIHCTWSGIYALHMISDPHRWSVNHTYIIRDLCTWSVIHTRAIKSTYIINEHKKKLKGVKYMHYQMLMHIFFHFNNYRKKGKVTNLK